MKEGWEKEMKDFDTPLSESEAARMIGMSVSGLRKFRRNGSGPRFIRLGRIIRYLASDIQAWLVAHTVESSSNGAGK